MLLFEWPTVSYTYLLLLVFYNYLLLLRQQDTKARRLTLITPSSGKKTYMKKKTMKYLQGATNTSIFIRPKDVKFLHNKEWKGANLMRLREVGYDANKER